MGVSPSLSMRACCSRPLSYCPCSHEFLVGSKRQKPNSTKHIATCVCACLVSLLPPVLCLLRPVMCMEQHKVRYEVQYAFTRYKFPCRSPPMALRTCGLYGDPRLGLWCIYIYVYVSWLTCLVICICPYVCMCVHSHACVCVCIPPSDPTLYVTCSLALLVHV